MCPVYNRLRVKLKKQEEESFTVLGLLWSGEKKKLSWFEEEEQGDAGDSNFNHQQLHAAGYLSSPPYMCIVASWTGWALSVWGHHVPPCVSVGFLNVLHFPPTLQGQEVQLN